jgi:serine/threonine-protein kinase
MAVSSTSVDQSEAGRAFLQHRLARYGLFGASIGFFFFAIRTGDWLTHPETNVGLTHPSMVYHFLAASSMFSIWLLCRWGKRSVGFARATEIVATFLACTFYALMGLWIPPVIQPHLIVLLALSFGLIARAIYVPSSAWRTFLITGICGVPLLVVTYLIYSGLDLEVWEDVVPILETTTSEIIAANVTLWSAAWWACAIAICTSASQVIYGLRKQVRDVKKLGQYTLVEKLGEGGMGMVYRAQHAMLRRPTAVKLLPVEKAGVQSIARFEKEVQMTAMLTHPNTVTIFDYGRTPDGVFYYAMEHLEGATLAGVVEVDGPQSPARVVRILAQAAAALAEAHAIRLIHRDIKPANIMLVEQGGQPDVAKVLDFGLVKELERSDADQLTRGDVIAGTPHYLAPEAITSPDSVDPRSDIYALGAVGYFLLTGSHVFDGATVVEVCAAHLHQEPVPPSERAGRPIPTQLEALILSCLAKAPADRPQSAKEVQVALRSCSDVGQWTDDDAHAWWERHGPAVRALQDRVKAAVSGLTMDIDLLRRESK